MSIKEIPEKYEKQFAILLSLIDLGGSASKKKILSNLVVKNYIYINHTYFKKLQSNGEPAWQNDLAWERQHLLDMGYLEPATRGIWKISARGKLLFIKLFYEKMNNTDFKFLNEAAFSKSESLIADLNF
jgi:hypothetical protein